MKIISMFVSVLVLVASAHAHESPLGEVMHQMGGLAKAISKQITVPESNADSAEKCDELRALIVQGIVLVPEKVAEMTDPAAQKLEYQEYQKSMVELYLRARELQTAFVKNDTLTAQIAFASLLELRKINHERFRKPEPPQPAGGQ